MKIFYQLDDLPKFDKASISIGNYDGLHLGHQKIFNSMRKDRNKIIISFSRSPMEYIDPENFLGYIFPENDKIKFIKDYDIDILLLLDFKEVCNIKAKDFLDILLSKIKSIKMYEGYNFRFGKDNKGNIDFLKFYSENINNRLQLNIIDKVIFQDKVVSSSRIREEISRGNVREVSKMLGRNYYIRSNIVKGDGIGKKLGFPTINIERNKQVLPSNGVYYTKFKYKNKFLDSMTYIGNRPTINGKELRIETNILDFNERIYKKSAEIYFIDKISEEKKFNNLEELQKTLYNYKLKIIDIKKNYNLEEKDGFII